MTRALRQQPRVWPTALEAADMAHGICSISGCGNEGRLARTWCLTHYSRWQKTGSLDVPPPPTAMERWAAKVQKDGPVPAYAPHLGPCWIWTGWKNKDGYGVFTVAELSRVNGKRRKDKALAHRWGYENFVQAVPADLDMDHLCRVVACVNYERHLEPVTRQINMLRGFTIGAAEAGKTHCKHGHEFTPENTRLGPHPRGNRRRHCRACDVRRNAERQRDWTRGPNRGRPLHPQS